MLATINIQSKLAICYDADDNWIFTCCKRGFDNLLGRYTNNDEWIKIDLLARENDSIGVVFNVQASLAACRRVIDDGNWVFTCSNDGLSKLLGRKVRPGEKIIAELSAIEQEQIMVDKNTRVSTKLTFEVKNLDGSDFIAPIVIEHKNTPLSTANAQQAALGIGLIALARMSDVGVYGFSTVPDVASAVSAPAQSQSVTVVNEDGSTDIVSEDQNPDDSTTKLYKINFGVVKKVSNLQWLCTNLGNSSPVGSIDGGLYQILPPEFAGCKLRITFDPATPPSFGPSDPSAKPVNFKVELLSKYNVLKDSADMTGTRVKGGFGLSGGDAAATQSIAITPNTTASCQVTLRF